MDNACLITFLSTVPGTWKVLNNSGITASFTAKEESEGC